MPLTAGKRQEMNAGNLIKQDVNAVFNQPPALENYNLFRSGIALQAAVEREGTAWIAEKVARPGEICGRAETLKLGKAANRFTPILKTHDHSELCPSPRIFPELSNALCR